MVDVFISYSSSDEQVALSVQSGLNSVGVRTFLAKTSIEPGSDWSEEILTALRRCTWVFFLASRASVQSHAVQHELGASLIQRKTVVPVLLDIPPEELPGWIGRYQAVDARFGPEELKDTIGRVGQKVNTNRFWSGIILGGLAIGAAAALRSEDN